ncbi:MAG: hypothetical protein IKN64_01570 [Desulfovibrio sp.]|nr:hypothetical protein [Desulfovibrio sp.]
MNASDYLDTWLKNEKRIAEAELERKLAVEHERALLEVREGYGLRIKELEEKIKVLEAQLEDVQGGEWRGEYPLLSMVVALIVSGKTREEIEQYLLAQGFPRNQIALLLRSKRTPPTDEALKKAGQRVGK